MNLKFVLCFFSFEWILFGQVLLIHEINIDIPTRFYEKKSETKREQEKEQSEFLANTHNNLKFKSISKMSTSYFTFRWNNW